ncbi:MAG: dehypoxanthine futalosine cyclase, partial [Sphingobacteriales bacterium]
MDLSPLYDKALRFGFLTVEEGVALFEQAPLTDLMNIAD